MARWVNRQDWDEEEDILLRRGVRHGVPRDLLLPTDNLGGNMRRSRSTGARPAFNLQVVQDNHHDDDSPPRHGHHRGRSRGGGRRSDDSLIDAVEDVVARELRRGRSRDPQVAGRDRSPFMHEMQLELMARERADRDRDRWELERERDRLEREMERQKLDGRESRDYEVQLARTRAEIKRLKDRLEEDERESRRKEERDRVLADKEREEREERERRKLLKLEWERKEQEDDEEKRRAVQEYQLKEARKRKEKEDADLAAISAFKKKQDEEKRKKEEFLNQLKREEEERKEKEKKEKEMWKMKIEEEKREEEFKKKKRQEEVEEELRKKLHKFGFQENQVDAIIDPKKNKIRHGFGPTNPIRQSNALVLSGNSGPTYIKIHRNHIDVETLKYFNLPWDYDTDTEYIIIYQEMDAKETEILFEHTRKLRRRTKELLIEDRGRKDKKQLAFVRRRTPSASPSRRKASPKRVIRLW